MSKKTGIWWQYEFIAYKGKRIWITDNDKLSATIKALHSEGASGRIRSRKVTVKKTKWIVEEP